MASERKMPGGEMASRILDFIWIVDYSGSMAGEKIQTLNYAIKQTIPDMRKEAQDNPTANLQVRAVKFSYGAQWHIAVPTPVDDFEWIDLEADTVTDMGKAFELVAAELNTFSTETKRLPPVLVLLTDGQPTDDYKKGLSDLMSTPWGKKSVRIAIAIGQDADQSVLEEFTGNKEMVLEAKNPQMLTKFIKWASTVVKMTSAPVMDGMGGEDDGNSALLATIPVATTDDEDDDVW